MAPRQLAVLLLLTLALAACAGPVPSSPSPPASGAAATPRGSGALLEGSPGRPYDAAAVLQAMRDSRRPGGVPAELQTDAIATAVAQELWTWDGATWPTMVIGGACGANVCTLDVAGTPAGAAGSDLYSLLIERNGARVTVDASDLHGYPASLDTTLDAAAQAAATDRLRGLTYSGARWLPPPDEGRYWLSYRSGGEEGSPGLDVLLDRASGQVLQVQPR